jgi:ATP-dependent exoDNAse (exonuclease V) beta subunit
MTTQQQTSGKFKVVRASAGSGKTYSLVREYLLLALKTKSADYYKHILAITFTNAAAAEMKERVIHRLRDLSESVHPQNPLVQELVQTLGIPPEELQERCRATYRHILHNYSQLSIQTIDGFTHKLIRSFARELKLSQDFHVELDTDAFIEMLADKCLDNIGNDADITRYLEHFALENLEEGSSWNIRQQLITFSKELFKEDALEAMNKLSRYTLDDFSNVRSKLHASIKGYENSLKQLAERATQLLRNNSIEPWDLAYGKSGGMMQLIKLSNDNFDQPVKRFIEMATGGAWYSKSAQPELKAAVDAVRPEVEPLLQEILEQFGAEQYGAYYLQQLVLRNIYVIGLLNSLNELSKQIKEENNLLLISDFHVLVNEVVRESPAPFIYERIGNRYKHILIDEFQDTSTLQWSNAVPLIENALGEDNMSLLVGDAKQSIYRWRGGRVEQFVDLPSVNIKTAFATDNSLFTHHFKEEILEKNFRSARTIIDFNNRFYDALAPSLGDKQKVYHKQSQQSVKPHAGYVRIDKVEGPSVKDRWPLTAELILQHVKESIADGYKPSDIAILTRRGESEGGKIAQLLSENGYEVVTQGSFLLQNSPAVRVVMAYLNYYSDPQKHFAAVDFIQSLSMIHPHISVEQFVQDYKSQDKKKELDLFGYLNLLFPSTSDKPASTYALAKHVIDRFGLTLDNYLECLLDHIRERTLGRGKSLPSFLEWWNTKCDSIYISSSAGDNAIRIMTVHKSKGLQFPVVIYPRFNSKEQSKHLWIETNEEEIGLPTALVTMSKMVEQGEDGKVRMPQEFYEETSKARLDDMNLCYVATTRAEDRLYMVVEQSETWLSKQIENVMNADFQEAQNETHWEMGEREQVQRPSQKEQMQLIHPPIGKPRQLKIRATRIGDDYSDEIIQGNLIHQALAEVRTKENVSQAVQRIASLHQLDSEKKQHLEKEVFQIIEHPQFARWFSEETQTMAERDISTSDGKIIRPDRVVIYADSIEVIDFKTGKAFEHHEQQVKEYIRYLKELYPLPVKGYLLYTNDRQTIEVMAN